MIKSCLLVLILSLCFAGLQADGNVCESPTILYFQEGDTATLEMTSNGDALLYPGSTDVRTTFVNQRQGALKFHTQVNFGENDVLCEDLVSYDPVEDTLRIVFYDDDNSELDYYDLWFDELYNSDDDGYDGYADVRPSKRSVTLPYYTVTDVAVQSEANVFSLVGNYRYFFSGNNVVMCLDASCSVTQIVNVDGQIMDAIEDPEFLLVLSVVNGNLHLSKIQSFQVISVDKIDIHGNGYSSWSILSASSFIGVISGDLSIVSIDGSVSKVETVGDATVKADNQIAFSFVVVQSNSGLYNYVCKVAECRKVSSSTMVNKIWDMDVAPSKKSIYAFADSNEITLVQCERFDCYEPQTSVILAPGVISNLKVSLDGKKATVVYSLENGATGILNCIDDSCSSLSLTRASDYVSSPNFSFIQNKKEFILYANNKVQSFSNSVASPNGEMCKRNIEGNHIVEDGEVFVCNALPTVANYSNVFFWAPVITSVFTQNL